MTQHIQLCTVELDDLPFVHKLFNDPNIMDFWFSEPYLSMERLKKHFNEEDNQTRQFILTNNEQEQLGLIGFYEIEHRHRHAEFGIAIDPIHQGKGYAKHAIRLALDYAFLVLNLHKVYLIVVKTNEKASYLYERAGFQIEGELVEQYFINGQYHNGIIMSIFAKDYIK